MATQIIAALALGLFWIHTLLIAAAACLDFRELGRLGRGRLGRGRLPRARVRAGVVRSGRGPAGVLARNVVEQVGRGKGDGVVHFSDAGHRSEVFGGVVELDGHELELSASMDIAVWPDLDHRAQAAARDSASLDDGARDSARRARGWPRSVEVAIGPGDRVFVVGPDSEPTIIAAIDPRRWIAGKRLLIVGFVFAELALAVGCTVLMLWPPLFDWVSMIGAAAALGLFLGVQPIGVAVQDAVRTPDRAYLRGRSPSRA